MPSLTIKAPESPTAIRQSSSTPLARAGGSHSSTLETRAELALIIEEPPGGENFGYRVTAGVRRESLNYRDWIKSDFLAAEGWSTCTLSSGAPRGRPRTIKPDWLTPAGIAAVEQRIGFTCDEFHAVVRKGRLSKEQRERREMMSARVTACVHAGAAVGPLADVLGCSPRTLWRLVRK
jgi:hypothetical protein